jgi:glycosyltransferase involved in cell wall biosynthesis
MPAATDRRLTVWLCNPFDDIPGEDLPPMRYWSLARALAARGHDVTWWTADWSHRRKARRTVPTETRATDGFGLELVPVRAYARNVSLARIASHRDFGRNLERQATAAVASGHRARPDVILASLPPLEGPDAAVRLARTHGARFILDVMDLWPETFERLLPGPEWLRHALGRVLLGRMRRRRRAVVAAADAVSAATRTYLDVTLGPARQSDSERGMPTHPLPLGEGRGEGAGNPRTYHGTLTRPSAGLSQRERHDGHDLLEQNRSIPRHVCYLGADLEAQAAGGHDAPARASGGPLECVYAGSLGTGQDVETLVAAARIIESQGLAVTLHVAGTGPLEPDLRSAAAAHRGPCRLVVHGLLPAAGYRRLLAACDVGLVLVKPESCVAVPYKACDYAAAGLALVSALPGELARLVDEHRAGLGYRAGDSASLAAAIARVAIDRRLLASLREGSRSLAAAAFDRTLTYAAFAAWIEKQAH